MEASDKELVHWFRYLIDGFGIAEAFGEPFLDYKKLGPIDVSMDLNWRLKEVTPELQPMLKGLTWGVIDSINIGDPKYTMYIHYIDPDDQQQRLALTYYPKTRPVLEYAVGYIEYETGIELEIDVSSRGLTNEA